MKLLRSTQLLSTIVLLALCSRQSLAFISPSLLTTHRQVGSPPSTPVHRDTWQGSLRSNRWDQEIEENSRRRAQGSGDGSGEFLAGAVLGGMIAGPFGR